MSLQSYMACLELVLLFHIWQYQNGDWKVFQKWNLSCAGWCRVQNQSSKLFTNLIAKCSEIRFQQNVLLAIKKSSNIALTVTQRMFYNKPSHSVYRWKVMASRHSENISSYKCMLFAANRFVAKLVAAFKELSRVSWCVFNSR